MDLISRRGEHQTALSGSGSIQYLWEAPPERVFQWSIQQTRSYTPPNISILPRVPFRQSYARTGGGQQGKSISRSICKP